MCSRTTFSPTGWVGEMKEGYQGNTASEWRRQVGFNAAEGKIKSVAG